MGDMEMEINVSRADGLFVECANATLGPIVVVDADEEGTYQQRGVTYDVSRVANSHFARMRYHALAQSASSDNGRRRTIGRSNFEPERHPREKRP